jgi:hypothetical protein
LIADKRFSRAKKSSKEMCDFYFLHQSVYLCSNALVTWKFSI